MKKIYALSFVLTMFLAPWTEAAAEDDVPAGESRIYEVSALSQTLLWDTFVDQVQTYKVKDIIFADDGKVYVPNFLYTVEGAHYTVGELHGDIISFQFPQEYVTQTSYDYETGEESEDVLSLFVLDYTEKFNYDEETGEPTSSYFDYSLSENQTLEFYFDPATRAIRQADDVAVGLGIMVDGQYYNSDYADQRIEMTDYSNVVTTFDIPDDLTFSTYVMDNYDYHYKERTKYFVDVAFDGDYMYLRGLFDRDPDMTSRFRIDGDVYSIPYGQCLGEYNGERVFAYPVEFSDSYETSKQVSDFSVKVDPESKVITPLTPYDGLYYNLYLSHVYYWRCFVDFTMSPQDIPDFATPGVAVNLGFQDSMWDDSCYFTFDYFCDSDNGLLLPSDRVLFRFYLDGDPVVFTPEEFMWFYEPMEFIPLNFTDGCDVGWYGSYHYINFRHTDTQSVGVRMYYRNEDGTLSEGNLATLTVGEGNQTDEIISSPTQKEYYDLSGRKIDNPSNGIYIVKSGSKVYKSYIR